VFHISIWGVSTLFGGLSSPKPPRGDGTGSMTDSVRYIFEKEVILSLPLSKIFSKLHLHLFKQTKTQQVNFGATTSVRSQPISTSRETWNTFWIPVYCAAHGRPISLATILATSNLRSSSLPCVAPCFRGSTDPTITHRSLEI